ncbi:MAG: glycosyltransferase family 4 protein [Croceitalea sp.]|nr:glycosyltransferase family 4 protein [Croceitalea sp.]
MSQKDMVDPILGFRFKKFFTSKNEQQKALLKNKHVWHMGKAVVGTQNAAVAHSLHTPFLDLKKSVKVATVHDFAVHLPQFEKYEFANDYFKKKRFKLFQEFNQKADAIIAVSQATKNDFLSFFDFPEANVHVVPLAPTFKTNFLNNDQVKNQLNRLGLETKGYFISVGGLSLRKNTFNLVKAYSQSKSKKDYKLVITGKIEEAHRQEVFEFIAKQKLESQILITNYIPNETLEALYHNAKAFLFPTFYEGFGIPILEAMAAKLPVLTSITGAAPQTAGGHAILVDPFDPESIAQGIDCLENVNSSDLEQAKQFAERFSWQRTASETVKIYEKYM